MSLVIEYHLAADSEWMQLERLDQALDSKASIETQWLSVESRGDYNP